MHLMNFCDEIQPICDEILNFVYGIKDGSKIEIQKNN